MKSLSLLVWMSQLGLSVALPPLGFILLAVWLRSSFGRGSWIIWLGTAVGVICAVDGLRTCLKAMEKMARQDKEKKPPVSFNDHD